MDSTSGHPFVLGSGRGSPKLGEYDRDYFLVFALLIVPFLMTADLLLFHAMELHYSWPVLRTQHGKLNELEFDE